MKIHFYILLLFLFSAIACQPDEEPTLDAGSLQLVSIRIGTQNLSLTEANENMPIDKPLVAVFSAPLDTNSVKENINIFTNEGEKIALNFSWLDDFKSFSAIALEELSGGSHFTIEISELLKGKNGEIFSGLNYEFKTTLPPLELASFTVDGNDLLAGNRVQNIPLQASLEIKTTQKIDPETLENSNVFRLTNSSNQDVALSWVLADDGKTISINTEEEMLDISKHSFTINNTLKGINGENFSLTTKSFYTTFSDEPKFEVISDDALLTLIQQQTFKYFWDFAHPVSGLARERNSSGDLVTIGGSGFGLMAWIVGAERGFISRQEAVDQFEITLNFLAQADRYHGVWPHWMDGNTGSTIPFSTQDDGADLVETSFLIQALLTWKQYLDSNVSKEAELITLIDQLYAEVEWDWFTRDGQNVLFWHWSPNYDWQMNLRIQGWNECLITYFLAAASPTHPIDAEVYHEGWARNGNIINGNSYYDIPLPLGDTRGGPLFYAHYSFLGLDPRGLSDSYANYFEQNRNHTLINRAYAASNPLDYVGHSEHLWGFTAGDNPSGYSAHSPTNDVGTIQPTAAISSIPYTPEESMEAIKTFYYKLGDRLWGEYGFYDGIDITRAWVADSYLAIDQGPIIIMIENHRTGLLWDLFMKNPEVQNAFETLDFVKTN